MKVQYFSWIRSAVGRFEETVELPGHISYLSELIEWLKIQDKQIKGIFEDASAIRIAVNQEIVTDPTLTKLSNESSIAFFSPISGG